MLNSLVGVELPAAGRASHDDQPADACGGRRVDGEQQRDVGQGADGDDRDGLGGLPKAFGDEVDGVRVHGPGLRRRQRQAAQAVGAVDVLGGPGCLADQPARGTGRHRYVAAAREFQDAQRVGGGVGQIGIGRRRW